jgi:hypothetical protein
MASKCIGLLATLVASSHSLVAIRRQNPIKTCDTPDAIRFVALEGWGVGWNLL